MYALVPLGDHIYHIWQLIIWNCAKYILSTFPDKRYELQWKIYEIHTWPNRLHRETLGVVHTLHIDTNTRIYIHRYSQIHTHTHACNYTHSHTQSLTCTHTHTHTAHTQSYMCIPQLQYTSFLNNIQSWVQFVCECVVGVCVFLCLVNINITSLLKILNELYIYNIGETKINIRKWWLVV